MSVLGDLAPRAFVERCWQKEPLLVRGALPAARGLVDGDTLAGLACEDGVASRLVTGGAAGAPWTCEHGPFDDTRFASLPAAGWTLLVQAVEQWLPEVAALLAHFDFLPRWRVDDVMVSVAADRGGVGPHFDRYDVFLLQIEGTRRWRIGQRCDEHSPLVEHPELKLLADFATRAEWLLAPGDLLYLPPGLAHWGIAEGGGCITCSIGFRAPSRAEVVQAAVDRVLARFGDDQRFADVPASIDADPFRINAAAIAAVTALWSPAESAALEQALATAFGRLVTEPRDPSLVAPETAADDRVLDAGAAGGRALRLAHHPSSRFAYRLDGDAAELFVDGEAYLTAPGVARGICHGLLPPGALRDDAARSLVACLLRAGSVRVAG